MPAAGVEQPLTASVPDSGGGNCVCIPQTGWACVHPPAKIQSSWQVGDSRSGQGYQEGKGSMLVPGGTCKCGVPLG